LYFAFSNNRGVHNGYSSHLRGPMDGLGREQSSVWSGRGLEGKADPEIETAQLIFRAAKCGPPRQAGRQWAPAGRPMPLGFRHPFLASGRLISNPMKLQERIPILGSTLEGCMNEKHPRGP